jgi:hypothetical protein
MGLRRTPTALVLGTVVMRPTPPSTQRLVAVTPPDRQRVFDVAFLGG